MKPSVLISLIILALVFIFSLVWMYYVDWIGVGTVIGVFVSVFFLVVVVVGLVFVAKKVKEGGVSGVVVPEQTQTQIMEYVKERILMERHESLVFTGNVLFYNRGEIMRLDGRGVISKDRWTVLVQVKKKDNLSVLKNPRGEQEIMDCANGIVNPLVLQDKVSRETVGPFGSERTEETITRDFTKADLGDEEEEDL